MAGRRPTPTYHWARGTVTVSTNGIVRLDGKRIGRVMQLNAVTFGAMSKASGYDLGIPMRPPPATLEAAVGAVYDTWVTEVLDAAGSEGGS